MCVEREERGRQTLAANELGGKMYVGVFALFLFLFYMFEIVSNREFKCSLRKYEEVL